MGTEIVTPRIDPVEAPYSPDVEAQLARRMPSGLSPIALFRTFVRNLPMAQAMETWRRYQLGRNLSLSTRDREIVIDRTCARCGCAYEWGVHVAFFADRVGLGEDQIASLAKGMPSDACWTEKRDRMLVRAVDAVRDTSDIPDELWKELSATFSDANLLDLLLFTGWYHAICVVARVARIPLETGVPTFGSEAATSGEGQ
jgi:alkylhydroperoxidase family enzyme